MSISPAEKKWFWAITILLAYAYVSHINFYPINLGTDEGIRALVAMEMNYSGDYIVPTLNGELYLNKPPMFNWILAASFKIFGYNAFALRFPSILSIFTLGLCVYYFTKKYVNTKTAWLAALLIMTTGRILIYESMLGYIDITYSWVTFLGFMAVFIFGEKKQYYRLFIISYLIMTVGYFLKGFPSFGFQGLTLLAYFVYTKNFKKLFHPGHFIGIFIFILIAFIYYRIYFNRVDLAPSDLFTNLLKEGSQRTPVYHSINVFLVHLYQFPRDMFYHYAPAMLLFFLLIRKDWKQAIRSNRYILFCAVTFAVNIIIYWLSPEIFARYIFMHLALLFTVFAFFYNEKTSAGDIRKKIIDLVLLILIILFFLSSFVLPFHPLTKQVSNSLLKSLFLIPLFGLLVLFSFRQPAKRIIYFFMALVIFRIAFNWFVIEQRGKENEIGEEDGKKIAAIIKGQSLYIFGRPINHSLSGIGDKNATSFNIAKHTKKIIRFNTEIDYSAYYLSNPEEVKDILHRVYYQFDNPGIDSAILIKFLQPANSNNR